MGIWEDFTQDIFGYSIDAYAVVEPYFWPLIFIGIIGFLYAGLNSITVAVVGILVTFGLFGASSQSHIFSDVPEIAQFLYIVALLGITLLIVTLFIKRRG